jgi:hypothetical protein
MFEQGAEYANEYSELIAAHWLLILLSTNQDKFARSWNACSERIARRSSIVELVCGGAQFGFQLAEK